MSLNKGLREFLEVIEEKGKAILIAPTGYGKTLASLDLVKRVKNKGMSAGLIHVVPLKSLVENIYREKFEGKGFRAGYQSQDMIPGGTKSPFFLRELVVTTLDSFMLNLYKAPVSEFHKILEETSLGHYYVPLSSILTSTVVFDEAHMYLGEADESISIHMVYAAVEALSTLNVPVVVETATMNTGVVGFIARKLSRGDKTPVVYIACGENTQLSRLKAMNEIELHMECDGEYERRNSIEWRTSIIKPGEVVNKALKAVENDRVVLVVRNTVGKAIETYRGLKERLGEDLVVLIHSRMSGNDRKRALEVMKKIMESGRGIVVSTQVIEAGVETDASVLISDAAPIESLAQRAGRLCRERSGSFAKCRESAGEVYLVEPGEERNGRIDVYDSRRVLDTFNAVKEVLERGWTINWRLLTNNPGKNEESFSEILEKASSAGASYSLNDRMYEDLLKAYLKTDAHFQVFKEMNTLLGKKDFFRNTIQLRLAVQVDGAYDYLNVDLDWFIAQERKALSERGSGCLEYDGDGRAMVLGYEYSDDGSVKPLLSPSRLISVNRLRLRGRAWLDDNILGSISLYEVVEKRAKRARYYAFLLRRECYEPGIGLVFPP